jgi:hypothetical protein
MKKLWDALALDLSLLEPAGAIYRGTSLIRNRLLLGPYSRTLSHATAELKLSSGAVEVLGAGV